jgi:hypothetical protein
MCVTMCNGRAAAGAAISAGRPDEGAVEVFHFCRIYASRCCLNAAVMFAVSGDDGTCVFACAASLGHRGLCG